MPILFNYDNVNMDICMGIFVVVYIVSYDCMD